jgi:ATP-binding cassette ChvD family protein
MSLVTLQDAELAFGLHPLLDRANFVVSEGERIGLIGRNGTGKSSLLQVIAGQRQLDDGQMKTRDALSVVLVEQEPELPRASSLRECLALRGKLESIHDERDRWRTEARLVEYLHRFGLDGATAPESASGGEKKRAALALALALTPDLLLLDEPTNHLDAESVAWLERFLKDYPGTVVAVTHDRYFLDNVAGWILELDRGHGIPYEGNYSGWLEQKSSRLQQEEKTESKRQKTLQRELDWIRMSPRARQAKGKARLNAYEQLLAEDAAQKVESVEIYIPPGPRLGDIVVEARGLKKAYGDTVLFDDLTFTLPRGGIVGVIGPNGAGKTTTFKLITGEEKPDAGTLRLGDTVQVGYVDQSRELNPDKSVFDEITGGVDELEMGKKKIASRAYVSWFNFKGAQQQRKVGTLSGGERNRVHLAKLLRQGSNLLLLDEPTNDLDVDTLRALEEALLNYAGCAVVISHDRWFLDRIATHILAFEGDSETVWFEGNYQDYEADRKRRLGAQADQPHRIKYRKLTRS